MAKAVEWEYQNLIMFVVAILVLIVLSFTMYPAMKGYWNSFSSSISKFFNFGNPNQPIKPDSAETYLTEVIKDFNVCAALNSKKCICPYTYNMVNPDYGIRFAGGKAYVIDAKSESVGKEAIISFSPCLYMVTGVVSSERMVRGDLTLQYEKRGVVSTAFGAGTFAANYMKQITTGSDGSGELADYLYKDADGNICFFSKDYASYMKPYVGTEKYSSNPLGLPLCSEGSGPINTPIRFPDGLNNALRDSHRLTRNSYDMNEMEQVSESFTMLQQLQGARLYSSRLDGFNVYFIYWESSKELTVLTDATSIYDSKSYSANDLEFRTSERLSIQKKGSTGLTTSNYPISPITVQDDEDSCNYNLCLPSSIASKIAP
jgi:hypothetical protein